MRRWPLAVGLSALAHAAVGAALWAAVRSSAASPPAEAPPPVRAPSLLRVGSLLPRAGAAGVAALGGGRRDADAPVAGEAARAPAVGLSGGSRAAAFDGAGRSRAAVAPHALETAVRAVERVAPVRGEGPEVHPGGGSRPGAAGASLAQDGAGPARASGDARPGDEAVAPAAQREGPPAAHVEGAARGGDGDGAARREGQAGVGGDGRARGGDGEGAAQREGRSAGSDALASTAGADVDLEALTRRVHARLSAVARDCYPAAARRFRQVGRVALAFCVDARAEAERVEASGSGNDVLVEAARDCVVRRAAPFPSEARRRCFRVAVDFEP